MWSIREQENREESCRNILPKKKLVIKKKKIYHRSKGNRVLSSINCLIAYQYRSGINGDRLLTSTRVSTTRAWEQAGSILRINCINVSPTHFPINHRAQPSWIVENQKFPPWRDEDLDEQHLEFSRRKRWLGRNERPCNSAAAIFLLGCQVSFNEEIK